MTLNLPAPVAAYIATENGRTMKGLAAIQRWKTETKQKYHHTVEPLAAVQKDGKTVVTGRLTGEFPGTPVELQFSSLEIRP
jgi:hypothetical protein